MMNFGNANLLFLLFLLPLLGLLGRLFIYKRKIRDLKQLGTTKTLAELIPDFKAYKKHLKRQVYFMLLWLLFLTIALLRPQYGWNWRENHKKGIDIVVAIDVSQSMLAKDVSPDRLQIAKRAITDLLNILQGDRVSLVIFAGTAFIETPLTEDMATFKLFLNSLNTNLVPVQGTNFELAFEKSIEAFTSSAAGVANNSRAIFMLTDGEELDGNLDRVKQKITELGIKLYILGIGTKAGAPIPVGNGNNYKKDAQGNIIISKLNGEFLENLAQATGGIYLPALADSNAAKTIYRRIKASLNDIDFETNQTKVWNEWYQLPLFLAVLMLLLRGVGRANSLLLITFFLVTPAFAESAEGLGKLAAERYRFGDFETASQIFKQALEQEPDNYKLNLGLGNSYYRQNKFAEAEQYFKQAVQQADAQQKAEAFYNLGNSLVQLGKYQEAVSAYQESLKIMPNQKAVTNNLEYAKKLLQVENQPQDNADQEQNQERQDNEQQNNSTAQSQAAEINSEISQSSANNSKSENSNVDESEQQSTEPEEEQDNVSNSSNKDSGAGQTGQQSSEQSSSFDVGQSASSEVAADEDSSQDLNDVVQGNEASADNQSAGEDFNFHPSEERQDLKEQSAIAGEALLNALKEDRGALKEFRRVEAIKQLKKYNNKLPNKDW
ncbi:MAG: tetratricopeptide repeat protein [Deltaproteobacteria bacterium]|jgi:Ca-activated chloride channel family protein|nr:tetratricopeptide repeat protein [Deltaproteobacteria bacterium]